MNAAQLQAIQTIRAGLPPALAQLWDAEHLSDVLPELPDPEPDAEPGPLDDPAEQAGYQAWRSTGIRTYNLHEAEAISAATQQPLGFGVFCSAFAWRLNGGGGWWTKTAPEWADDLGISVEQFRKVQTIMRRLHLVRRKIGRCNVTSFQLDFDAITGLTHAHGEGMGVDFKGLAGRFEGNPQTVKQGREKFHSLRDSRKWFEGNPQTRIQGKEYQNPPAHPVDTATQQDGTRTPGEDDEENATSTPPAPAKPAVDIEAAADALIRACGEMNVTCDAETLRSYCRLRDVTPAEANHAIGVARASPNPIESVNYFKTVIESARKDGRRRETPVGGVRMDDAITRRVIADLDHAAQHRAAPEKQADSMAKMRAALRKHSKALTGGS